MPILETLIGSVASAAVKTAAKGFFEEPKPEPKSNAGALLTGAALGLGGVLVAGMIASSSDKKGNQSKPAGQTSTDSRKSPRSITRSIR